MAAETSTQAGLQTAAPDRAALYPITLADLQQTPEVADRYILDRVEALQQNGWWDWLMDEYERESSADPDQAYPSQGLRSTEYDGPDLADADEVRLDDHTFEATLHGWLYYLELFNHPDRLAHLFAASQRAFTPPRRVALNPIFMAAKLTRRAISIDELALHAQGAEKSRTQRKKRFEEGPFVRLGRQARMPLVGSANPEVWGSAPAVASMAMAHCLVGIPRDGVFKKIGQQVDLFKKAWEWLDRSPILAGRAEADELLAFWRRNLMGVLEADGKVDRQATPARLDGWQPLPDAELLQTLGLSGRTVRRALALYRAGARTFRIYSPEPGAEPLEALFALRALQRKLGWEPVEIFVGQVVSVEQALALQRAGADGIYIGIGGGGRCITGLRGNLAIDWPQLVWELRGRLRIPIIVEGGASENIGASLALGVTGIGVTRIVGGGTIESPGGRRYLRFRSGPDQGKLFKPYGGEAAARMKAMGGKVGPLGTIPYVEGETTTAELPVGRGNMATLMQRLFLLAGDTIMALVFQNFESIQEMQNRGPASLRHVSPMERLRRGTH